MTAGRCAASVPARPEPRPLPRARTARKPPARGPDPVDEPGKRRAILHAAVKVFAEKGYSGCRIADVARAAGVAYGLVYHYFRDKQELLESVFAEQWAIFVAAVRAIREGPGTAPERIAAVCRFALDAFRTAPSAVRVLLLEVARTPNVLRAGSTRQTFEAAARLVAEVVAEGQARGEIRGGADPLLAATGILGALELTLTGMVVGLVPCAAEDDVERAKREVVELVLRGVGAN